MNPRAYLLLSLQLMAPANPQPSNPKLPVPPTK